MKVESEYPNHPINIQGGAEQTASPSPLYTAPTDMVELPSKGKIYPKSSPLHKGRIEVKYMTAKEEDILSTQSFIEDGTVLKRLLQSVIVTPGVEVDDLVQGDIDALTIATRIYGYGSEYSAKVKTPSGDYQTTFFDLSQITHEVLEDQWLKESGKNEFDYELPFSKVKVTFKLLSRKESDELNQIIRESELGLQTIYMKYHIVAVNGNYDRNVVNSFVENALLARDVKELKNYIEKVTPKVNLSLEVIDRKTNTPFSSSVPIGPSFFWPNLNLED